MNTRDKVLAALRRAGEAGLSGEALAADLGVSRVAVSKHVAALRELGYEVTASPAAGYRLVSSPDKALPTEVGPLLRDPLWCRIEGGPFVTSTNDDACTLARDGAPEGTVVVAGAQLNGRGRFGREWRSPEGGAYVSAVLRPAISPSEAGPMSLVVALGIARGLETLGVHAGIKWPNDVWIGRDKVAGVLLEMAAQGDCVEWVCAGFGINVRRDGPPESGVAYLCDHGPIGVPEAAAAALDGLAEVYREWRVGGFAALGTEFRSRSVLTGEPVVVSDIAGVERARGIVLGVDDDGRLLVGGDGDMQAIASGEVTLRSPAS